jgi:outer membrane protein OmpA-like peptidoglycan-associated protein
LSRPATSTHRSTAAPLHHNQRLRRIALSLLTASAVILSVRPTCADTLDFNLNIEGGVGTMLSSDQQTKLHYGLDVEGAVRPGLVIKDPLTLQLVVASWLFPSSAGYGRATLLGVGLRFDPQVGSPGRLVVDGHAGAGLTGSDTRPMFDVGVGYEFGLSGSWGLGPIVRYGEVLHDNVVNSLGSAKFVAVAASLTWRPGRRRATHPTTPGAVEAPAPSPAGDADADGIPDAADACPKEAAGRHPDPRPDHRGCPAGDRDHDGITDEVDRCPDLAQGETPDPDRAGCPDGDDDKDGVANHRDQCPAQPAGLLPDPARPGCPARDGDNDSVPDAVDACPDRPGAPSSDPKKNGCPGLVSIEAGQIRISQQLFFATGNDVILRKSFSVLAAVGDVLRSTPGIRKVSIGGHTDTRGSADKNLALSQKRAESVRAWLVNAGIDVGRLEAKGFGGTEPIASNKTTKGRAANRRVEFVITDPPQDRAQRTAN